MNIIDDIDGSKDAEEVSFSYNGIDYQIDLGKRNRRKLETALRPFIEASSAASKRAAPAPGVTARRDLQDVRAWAAREGMKVSDRGRIPNSLLEQYDAAH